MKHLSKTISFIENYFVCSQAFEIVASKYPARKVLDKGSVGQTESLRKVPFGKDEAQS